MKFTLATLLSATLLAQTSHGWTFTWRDGDANPHVETGRLFKDCTKINHARGRVFSWDRPTIGIGANCCINLYSNDRCTGSPQGFSCKDWRKTASVGLQSYSVNRCLGF